MRAGIIRASAVVEVVSGDIVNASRAA